MVWFCGDLPIGATRIISEIPKEKANFGFVLISSRSEEIVEQLRCMGLSLDWSRMVFTMDEVCSYLFPSNTLTVIATTYDWIM